MNFDLAAELLEEEGVQTATVRGVDDVAIDNKKDRRGIAGGVLVIKIAGAASNTFDSLEEVVRVTQKAVDGCSTMGVGIEPGIMLNTGESNL